MDELNFEFCVEQKGKSVTFRRWNEISDARAEVKLREQLYQLELKLKDAAAKHWLEKRIGEQQTKQIKIQWRR